jgi:hypothetical protein
MNNMQESMELNRRHWDDATDVHARGNTYGIEDFRRGQCRLHRIKYELDEQPAVDPARPFFPYFGDPKGMRWPASPDYADRTITTGPSHDWQHTLSDIVCALIEAGLSLEYLHEFPFCAWQALPAMVQVEHFSDSHGYWGMPPGTPNLPLMFSIRAHKPK